MRYLLFNSLFHTNLSDICTVKVYPQVVRMTFKNIRAEAFAPMPDAWTPANSRSLV